VRERLTALEPDLHPAREFGPVARPGIVRSGAAGPFLLRLYVHRLEVELAVEVHGDAADALFALVMIDLSRRLRPHGSRPASAVLLPAPTPQ
jgi:hypothetical protein